jgi:hypothetical protein
MSRSNVLLKLTGATQEQRQDLAMAVTSFFKIFFGVATVLILAVLILLANNYIV